MITTDKTQITKDQLTTTASELLAALKKLDRLDRGLGPWHEDAFADAWVSARTAIANSEKILGHDT